MVQRSRESMRKGFSDEEKEEEGLQYCPYLKKGTKSKFFKFRFFSKKYYLQCSGSIKVTITHVTALDPRFYGH